MQSSGLLSRVQPLESSPGPGQSGLPPPVVPDPPVVLEALASRPVVPLVALPPPPVVPDDPPVVPEALASRPVMPLVALPPPVVPMVVPMDPPGPPESPRDPSDELPVVPAPIPPVLLDVDAASVAWPSGSILVIPVDAPALLPPPPIGSTPTPPSSERSTEVNNGPPQWQTNPKTAYAKPLRIVIPPPLAAFPRVEGFLFDATWNLDIRHLPIHPPMRENWSPKNADGAWGGGMISASSS